MPIRTTRSCAGGVCDPERTQGLVTPGPQGPHGLVQLKGPGIFIAAAVSKQGGANGVTFVSLDIDGRNVINISYAAAQDQGLTQQNPFGLVLLSSPALKTLTIGFPTPLRFETVLKLSAAINEPGVVQILADVIHGSV